MPDSKDAWALKGSKDVAEALDWLRRRMGGNGLVLVAIGKNSVAYSKDAQLAPIDAVGLVEMVIERGTLARGFEDLRAQRVTRGASRREDL